MDRDTFLALASALEDFGRAGSVARGGQRNTGQFYNTLAEAGQKAEQRKLDEKKAQAEMVRQSVLDKYKANEETRAQAKFEAEKSTGEDDPNSPTSTVMRNVLSKRFPDQDFTGMTARQMKALPLKAEAASGGSNKRFANLTDDDGVVRSYLVDLDTGEKKPVGKAGFAQSSFEDPVTGERAVFNPSLGAARPLRGQMNPQAAMPAVPAAPAQIAGQPVPSTGLLPGETPKQRDVRVGLETKQTEGKIKSEQERSGEKRASEEKLKNLEMMENDLMKLHKKSSLTGPIAGQGGKIARAAGYNPDANAAAFEGQVQLWANDYIQSISGAGVPVKEFEERFRPLLPSVTDTSDLAAQKFKNFKEFVKRTYEAKYGTADKTAAARKWLEANPNDPRAEAIRQKLGGK